MTTVDTPAQAPAAPPVSAGGQRALGRNWRQALRIGLPIAVFLVAMFIMPTALSTFWVKVFTSVAIFSVVCLAAGLLYGRVGMVSLCQIGLLSVGTWVTLRLGFATHWPLPVIILIAGVVTGVIGVGIGLPALRLSGLYLALVTLMAAAGAEIVLNGLKFPNGGSGFDGVVHDTSTRKTMRRMAIAGTDPAYFRFAVIVAALMFLLVVWHLRSRPGRAWANIRQSEAAALAGGVNITVYKLWAFALASFMTGIAGGVLAAEVGSPSTLTFVTQENVILFAVVVIGGVTSLWGAVVGGLLREFLPEFLKERGISDNLGLILFGLGVLANLVLTSRAARKKGVSA